MQNKQSGCFLHANRSDISNMVQQSYSDLLNVMDHLQSSEKNVEVFNRLIKERIQPINSASLLNPAYRNMYRHTAVKL
jgi:hypothetical protein